MHHPIFSRTCLALFCFATLSYCHAASETFRVYRLNSETIVYRGNIVAKKSLRALQKHITKTSKTLLITSPGGDLSEGVKIGNLLVDRAMSVEVAGYCMSSCANNIFLAGRIKTLRPDSVVGFHGSSRGTHGGPSAGEQDDEEKGTFRSKLIAQFDRMATEEAQLLQRLHLDPDILVEMMDRLENKLPPNEVHFVLTVNGKKIEIADGDGFDQRIKSALEEIASKEALKSVQLSRANPYGDAVFFPNQQTLESFGVTGIKAYFYPTDEKQLQQLEEQIKKRIGTSKLRFAGDFPEAE